MSTKARVATPTPNVASYPFSKTALTPPPQTFVSTTPVLQKGKGLMVHLKKTLFTPEKYAMMQKLFSRQSPSQLRVGSIVSVLSDQAPNIFTGVLIAIRRRGPDSSIRVRNILQRTGTEMLFFVNSPSLKEIKVLRQPPRGQMRRAKLYYLRDSPEKMSMLAGGKQ
jgi:large subunit ribosomal protein L19